MKVDFIIMIITCVLAISAGAWAIKVSKWISFILYLCGMGMLVILCENYHYNRVSKESLPPRIEQTVEIITYKNVCGMRIPIDTIQSDKFYY